jgi:hypothetical protein
MDNILTGAQECIELDFILFSSPLPLPYVNKGVGYQIFSKNHTLHCSYPCVIYAVKWNGLSPNDAS